MLSTVTNNAIASLPPAPMPPPTPSLPRRSFETNDAFESLGQPTPPALANLVFEQALEIKHLRADNEQLLATIEDLRAQLKIYEGGPAASGDSLDQLRTSRLELCKEIAALETNLDALHLQHSGLLELAQNDDAIREQMKTMGAKATKLSAKMSLQNSAKEFETKEIAPLNLRHSELFLALTKATLRLTHLTPSKELLNESIIKGLTSFLEQPENKPFSSQIRSAINTHPGQKAHDIKAILNASLLKFLEQLRPEELSLREWSSYLGCSATNADCASILLHYGIDNVGRLTSAVEQYLTHLWKEEDKRITEIMRSQRMLG